MAGDVFFWMFLSLVVFVSAGAILYFRKQDQCSFKIYAPYLTCWKWYLSLDRPYTQKIFKIALQIDITNVSDATCTIRNLELFVISKGEKYQLPLLENGMKLKSFDIKGRTVLQKMLQVPIEKVEPLPICFPNEQLHFYLSYRENRKKAETTRIHKVNYIMSTPEKA
jgi:hypothetical protein